MISMKKKKVRKNKVSLLDAETQDENNDTHSETNEAP
jgi:hypothetical protein